jgi:hypothetical protein
MVAIGNDISPAMLAVVGGLSAATSLTLPTADPLEPRTRATRVLELGVLLPIVGGGLALAVIRSSAGVGGLLLLGESCAIVLAAALAAFLLLTQATSETEERVVVVSALLLCGGIAAALGQSALMAGLVAGVFWRLVGRRARDTIARDVLFVQHPLLVLVLLVAGARTVLSPHALALGATYALLRTLAKRLEAAFIDRAVRERDRHELGRHLLRPGIFGVAFALNVVNVAGDGAAPLLATIVVGTVAAEFIALAFRPVRPRA